MMCRRINVMLLSTAITAVILSLPLSQTAEAAYCESLENDAYCLSGEAQGQLDAELECRLASETYSKCARSESGSLCGSFSISASEIADLAKLCPASSSCSETCQIVLIGLKGKFGCCINHYSSNFNKSSKFFSPEIFKDSLWRRCKVDLPPMKCKNHALNITLPNSTASVDCTVGGIAHRGLSSNCQENGPFQRAIDILLKKETCFEENLRKAKSYAQKCLLDSEGGFCFLKMVDHTNGPTYFESYSS